MARTVTAVACRLDVGRQRSHNEDSLGCRQAASDDEAREFGDLFVLADGMGGHAAGEVASRMAVDTIISTYFSHSQPDILGGLTEAILVANSAINTQAGENPDLYGMGTTCVCGAVYGDKLHMAHVGDSRAYFLRDDIFEQITEDHSWVEEQVRQGLLTSEEARNHPMRNIITRALGNDPEVKVDLSVRKIQPDDILLICSDGLTAAVEDEAIKGVLTSQSELQVVVDTLVDMANLAGGPDNISVIAVRIEAVVPVAPHEEARAVDEHPRKGWTRFLPFS